MVQSESVSPTPALPERLQTNKHKLLLFVFRSENDTLLVQTKGDDISGNTVVPTSAPLLEAVGTAPILSARSRLCDLNNLFVVRAIASARRPRQVETL